MAEVRGDNAGCPRCGAPLHCGAAEASCECAQLRLDDATRAALVAALKSRIANFKVPKQVFAVAELPRNTMGKVQKNLLREQHKNLFAPGAS